MRVFPRIVPVADRAVLIELGGAVGPEVQAQVWALDRALRDDPVAGQVELVPAMVNLMLVFDPFMTDHAAVSAGVERHLARLTVAAVALAIASFARRNLGAC